MADDVDSDDTGDSSIVDEARKRFKRAEDYYGKQRQLAIADTQFVMGDSDNGWQWPNEYREQRVLAQKVVLTVNMTAQHCNQIINQIRQNKPTAKVSPVDNGADKKTAEILGGLLRNVQVSSNADDAHDVGAEHAIYGGEGYWRIFTDYESPESFNQVIKIRPCSNPNLVFVDPDAKELDRSDAQWGFVFEDISREQFKREYPKIDPSNWLPGPTNVGWVQKDTFRRAEYFYCEIVEDTALMLPGGRGVLKSSLPKDTRYVAPEGEVPGSISGPNGERLPVFKERPTERKQWYWCKLVGGHDQPLDKRTWPGDYLPIVSVIGKEVNVNGDVVRKGIVRDLKDPARMVNYAYSETVQTMALQNKVPYMAAAEALEGYEEIWKSANLENRPYLPFNALRDDGTPIPQPSRQAPTIMPQAQVQLLQLSTEQMRAASGQQNSNFGIKSEAQSGIGIERLKVQGEIATFHFPDNLRRALQYEAKVIIDLIQKVYDTKRVVRILGLDGKEETAVLDPGMPKAYHENPTAEDVERIFNPLMGRYDVVINTGPAFQTQRQEAFAALTELSAKNPQLMQVAGDLIMRSADFPMAEELAARLEKTLPPGLADDKTGQGPKDPQAQMMIQSLDQAIQGMSQEMEQLQQENQKMAQELANKQGEIEAKQGETMVKDREADAKMVEAQAADKEAEAKLIEAKADLIRAQKEPAESDDEQESQALTAIQQQLADLTTALSSIVDEKEKETEEPAKAPTVNLVLGQKSVSKTISIKGPSGAVYTGTVNEQVPDVQAQ